MYNAPGGGGMLRPFMSSIAPRDGSGPLLWPPVTFSFTLTSNESTALSPSASVFRFFLAEALVGSASGGRFLHERCLVPGLLSGPLRFGTASYSHSLFRRRQLWQNGLVESQRIFRARLICQQIKGKSISHDKDRKVHSPLPASDDDGGGLSPRRTSRSWVAARRVAPHSTGSGRQGDLRLGLSDNHCSRLSRGKRMCRVSRQSNLVFWNPGGLR